MRRLSRIALIGLFLAAAAAPAFAYTGTVSVWGTKRGSFTAKDFAGTRAGIQACHDSLKASGGGTMRIGGAGRVQIDQTLRWSGSGITVEAISDSVVFESSASIGDSIIVNTGSHNRFFGLHLEGYKVSKTVGQGIAVMAGTDIEIARCIVNDMPEMGIHVHDGTSWVKVHDNVVTGTGNVGTSQGIGITIHGCTNADVYSNTVTTSKSHNIWVQMGTLPSRIINIHDNVSLNAGADGIAADSGCVRVKIVNNQVYYAVSDGITCDADSSDVGGNTIAYNGFFGLWSEKAGNSNNWWGNLLIKNGAYSMGLEVPAGYTSSGWLITGNFSIQPNGIGMEVQAGLGAHLSNAQIEANYFIGNGFNKPQVRVIGLAASTIDRVHIKANVIKDSVNHGIFLTQASGSPVLTNIVVTENDIMNCAGRGIATNAVGAGSTAFISDNYLKGNAGGDQESLSTSGWTYEGVGKRKTLSSNSIVQDSLRVGTSTVSAPSTFTGSPTFWSDVFLKNTKGLYWTNSSGANMPVVRVDSVNTVRVYPITGGNVDVFKADGTLNVRFYGAGETSFSNPIQFGGFRFLKDADPDRYIINRNTSGGIAFRPLADDRHNFYIKNGGAAWGAQSITAKDSLVAESMLRVDKHAIILDSLRVNKTVEAVGSVIIGNDDAYQMRNASGTVNSVLYPGQTDSLNFKTPGGNGVFRFRNFANTGDLLHINQLGRVLVPESLHVARAAVLDGGVQVQGTSWIAGKFNVSDSLRVDGRSVFGSSVTDTMVLKRGMVLKKDGSAGSTIIQNTGNIIEMTNAGINAIRASDAAGAFRIQTGGTTARMIWESTGQITQSVGAFLVQTVSTLPDNTTPTVANGNNFVCTPAGATTITDFSNGVDGQTIRILFTNGNATINDSGNFRLNGGFTSTADDMLVLLRVSGVWYEISRSPN